MVSLEVPGKRTSKRIGNGFLYNYGYRGRSINGKIVLEHTWIVERVLGKKLPEGAEIHHVNENRTDNRSENLVVCQDRAYHQLLHLRMRAFAECGNPNWRRCIYCKRHDNPTQMRNHGKGTFKHRICATNYERNRRKNHG